MPPLENLSRVEQKATTNLLAQLPDLMERVLDKTKAHGATAAFVTVEQDVGFTVVARSEDIETVSFHDGRRLNLVVYKGQRQGSVSSTDMTPHGLDMLIKAALDIAEVSAIDPCFGLPDKALATRDFVPIDIYYPCDISPQAAIEQVKLCEKYAYAYDKRITNSEGSSFSKGDLLHAFASTDGAMGYMQGTRYSLACALIAEEEQAMQRDGKYVVACSMNDLSSPEDVARLAGERVISRLGARKLTTRTAPVLFSSRVSSGLLGLFIKAISGGNLYRQNSFLLNAIGKQIFPKDFTIYEDPHIPRGLGSAPFDSDGVATRRNCFVDNGYIQQYVLGTYSARRLGLQTTANAGGVHNLTLQTTTHTFNDLLKQMGEGLLVTELLGQGVNILTGDYSRGAVGFWVENGVIQYPVEEVTIAGHLLDMYQSIRAVGDDVNPNLATRCGSLLIDGMMISGD